MENFGSGEDGVSGRDALDGQGADAVAGPGRDALDGQDADAVAGPGYDALDGQCADAVAGPAAGNGAGAPLLVYKICPVCKKKNAPHLIECSQCESDLTRVKVTKEGASSDDDVSSPREVEPAPAETELVRICDCGERNAAQARKCAFCGEDISDIIPVRVPLTGNKKERTPLYELRFADPAVCEPIYVTDLVVGREAALAEHLREKLYVSRRHAALSVKGGKIFIENLSRTNGTYLNGDKLPDEGKTELRSGDEIGLGGKVIEGKRQEKAAYLIIRVKI